MRELSGEASASRWGQGSTVMLAFRRSLVPSQEQLPWKVGVEA